MTENEKERIKQYSFEYLLLFVFPIISDFMFILNSTGWFLVLVILIPIVDLIICGVRVWISFDFYYNRLLIIGCLWEWMYYIVYLIYVLCLLNDIDGELMVCIVFWLWSSFRLNLYEFIYNICSATDFTG